MIKDQLIHLATLMLILAGMFLRAVAKVLIALAVLWLVGHFFPFVAGELGLPCDAVFDCFREPVETLSHGMFLGQFWPIILIVAGVVMLIRALRAK